MERKTSIQELIIELETMKKLSALLTADVLTGLDIAIEQCNRKLESEKNHIVLAFNQGYRDGFSDAQSVSQNEKDIAEFEDANVYFKKTYSVFF